MIIEQSNEKYVHSRIPGLALTEKGSLLGYYEARNSSSDWAAIDIKVIRSTDKGETWETTLIIPGEGHTMNNPVMISDGDTIHFLYCRDYVQLFYCKSTDDGLTFSPAVEITSIFDNCGFFFNVLAVGPGHSIRYKDHLVVPIWFAENHEEPKAHCPSFVATIYSKDGSDWKLGEVLGKDMLIDGSECALAITADNKLLISMRNSCPCKMRAFAISESGYDNWENLHFQENMPDPICQGSMTHLNGTLFHINCANAEAREDLTIKVSRDNFESYESIYVDKKGGYSDIAVDEDTLYVFYERLYDRELHFEAIRY